MPEWLNAMKLRIKAILHKRRLNRDLAEELAFHRAMLQEKLERNGANAEEASSGVRQTFGDERRWHERLTELWQFRWLENLWRDVSFGTRLLRKSPGFTAIGLLTLALGIGANTAVFSLVDALLLRPLPVPHADQLMTVATYESSPEMNFIFCAPLLHSLEKRHDIFQNLFATASHNFQIKTRQGVQSVRGALVSGEFFDTLQVHPQLGRYLVPADDRPGGNPAGLAVVINDAFWKTWFNRAPDVIGRKLVLDNVPFTIVGVMPRSFIGADPTGNPNIYAPLAVEPMVDAPIDMIGSGFHAWWFVIAGRRREGWSIEQTNTALRTASLSIVADAGGDSRRMEDFKAGKTYFTAFPDSKGFSYLRMQFQRPLLLVFSLCAAVLLLGCLNLASLLMARAAAREREMATRLAIGASRKRLVQQLMVESLLLAIFGTTIGIAISPFVSRLLVALLTRGPFGSEIDTRLDMRVLLFAAGTALFSTVLVGLLPVLQVTRSAVNEHLKDHAATFRSSRSRRVLPRILLSFEMALALVVVVGAGLLATSLVRLYRTSLGFDPKGLTLVSLEMAKQPLDGPPLLRFYQDLSQGLNQVPGVRSASYTSITPMSGGSWMSTARTHAVKDFDMHMVGVGPQYFKTMRIPVYGGREFDWKDTSETGPKIIINQALAKAAFPEGHPIGQHIIMPEEKGDVSYEVVGVVGNTIYEDLRKGDPPTGYVSITQDKSPKPSYSAVLRISGSMVPVTAAVRSLTARMAPDIPAPIFQSMNRQIDESISTERMMAILAVFFAVCALLVTGIGLYGTLAYTTARRTSEIGIRMALGAQRRQVALLIFRENAMIAVIGSFTGLGVALLASRALATQLYNTSTHDVPVMLLSVAALGLIACAASLLPAVRASRIEPMQAIRHE